jgi:hypothetical protein
MTPCRRRSGLQSSGSYLAANWAKYRRSGAALGIRAISKLASGLRKHGAIGRESARMSSGSAEFRAMSTWQSPSSRLSTVNGYPALALP